MFSAYGPGVFAQVADKEAAKLAWRLSTVDFYASEVEMQLLGNHRLVGKLWLFRPCSATRTSDPAMKILENVPVSTTRQHEGEFVDRSATEEE